MGQATTFRAPSVRASILTRRTYNRPLDAEGKVFETWPQTIQRVREHQTWLWERAQGGALTPKQLVEMEELSELMLGRMVAPAGRTLWLGGTELVKRREASNFNCFARDTQFITLQGVKSFGDFKHGDVVTVLTHLGKWRRATVHYHGTQPLWTYILRRGRSEQVVRATVNHRWILDDGTETTSLDVGDKLCRPAAVFDSWNYEDAAPDERMYWAYGYIYGDGTLCRNQHKESTHSMVRLCGTDKAAYVDRFEELGFSTSEPLSCHGDAFAYTGSYLKTLPEPSTDNIKLLRAFVRGYLDADGEKNGNFGRSDGESRFRSIQATSTEAQAFIRSVFPMVGVYIAREDHVIAETNLGTRSNDTIRFGLSTTFGTSTNMAYVVADKMLHGHADVWCLDVDEDHSFTMPNGIVTGNCAFLEVRTIHDLVDAFWLLLQGCGVGFKPNAGALSGFTRKMDVEIIRSTRVPGERGRDENTEVYDQQTRTWTVSIGDSAEAWAKAVGKIVAGKFPARKLVIDLSEIRGGGTRLKGYGWICSGDGALSQALDAICTIMNKQAGKLLSKMDILDILNWLGTVLSSRRSAQIGLMDYGDSEWFNFATAKAPKTLEKLWHRQQSNNSLVFWEPPTKRQLKDLFDMIVEHGGAEPGFVNAQAALQRAPWWKGLNPCAEILLANYGFCNLVELDVARWRGDHLGMHRALRLIARANYRQTMVNLRDGILQDAWHQTNEFLRLCGVGLTGIVRRPDLTPYEYRQLRYTAVSATYEQADELGAQRPKNVTTLKPSGTLSKAIFDTTDGAHCPPAEYIFNNIVFSRRDPGLERLLNANYHIFDHPNDPDAVLVRIPYHYEDVKFDVVNGHSINRESALTQLERYKMLQDNYVDHNTSITVSYEPDEVKGMIDWYLKNWNSYVATSFLFRNDVTKTAADLGFAYLPQEAVTKKAHDDYARTLLPVDFDNTGSVDSPLEDECASGHCPLR